MKEVTLLKNIDFDRNVNNTIDRHCGRVKKKYMWKQKQMRIKKQTHQINTKITSINADKRTNTKSTDNANRVQTYSSIKF